MIIARKKDNFFILSGFLIVLFIVYFQMNYQLSFVSMLFTMSFLWLFVWFAIYLKSYKQPKSLLYVIACAVLSSIHVLLLSPYGVSFDYYNKLIMFICFLLFTYLCSTITIKKKMTQKIFYINVVLSLLYVFFYKYGFQIDTRWMFLTLNFANPNMTGIFLSYSFMYVFLFSISYKDLGYNKWLLLLTIPLAVMLVYLVILTACRSALLTVLCFIFIVLIDKLLKGKLCIKKWIVGLWSIFPLLFAIVYTVYQGSIGVESFLVNDDIGKSSGTRMVVWGPAFDAIGNNILFGDYCGISNGTGISQLHNTHLDVMASYGFFPFTLFVLFLYKSVKTSLPSLSDFNKYSLCAFMTCFVSGIFEATLVAGGLCLYILACGFLLLANSKLRNPYESNPN